MYPKFKRSVTESSGFKLDVMVEASGFTKKDMKALDEVRTLHLFIRYLSHIFLSTWKHPGKIIKALPTKKKEKKMRKKRVKVKRRKAAKTKKRKIRTMQKRMATTPTPNPR